MSVVKRLLLEEDGQGITEYALILGLVILGVWIAVNATGLGPAIAGLFGRVTTEVTGCVSGSCP